jgi:hypothetical protein
MMNNYPSMAKVKVMTGLFGLVLTLIAGAVVAGESTRSSRSDNKEAQALYDKECGGCHVAYVPRLLPRQSWQRLLNGLSDHFGDNAELDAAMKAKLEAYLGENARKRGKSSQYTLENAPLRITELAFFRHEHDEIPARIRNDPKVGKMSQCDTCHQDAKAGRFDEGRIRIPGYGRWED